MFPIPWWWNMALLPTIVLLNFIFLIWKQNTIVMMFAWQTCSAIVVLSLLSTIISHQMDLFPCMPIICIWIQCWYWVPDDSEVIPQALQQDLELRGPRFCERSWFLYQRNNSPSLVGKWYMDCDGAREVELPSISWVLAQVWRNSSIVYRVFVPVSSILSTMTSFKNRLTRNRIKYYLLFAMGSRSWGPTGRSLRELPFRSSSDVTREAEFQGWPRDLLTSPLQTPHIPLMQSSVSWTCRCQLLILVDEQRLARSCGIMNCCSKRQEIRIQE